MKVKESILDSYKDTEYLGIKGYCAAGMNIEDYKKALRVLGVNTLFLNTLVSTTQKIPN
jgi:hypothetical protein